MRRAFSLLKRSESYRGEAFAAGLMRHGFEMQAKWNAHPEPGDLLLMWNRNRSYDSIAAVYERAGATVLVAENGYFGSDAAGHKLFALARGYHNGAGWWHVGDEPRSAFELKPWRESGKHIVVLPQRGIGPIGIAMPAMWPVQIARRLKTMTDRPIVVRKHPGASRADPWPDLKGAHCAVTWGSGAGIKAIAYGVPVFHCLGEWIGAPAAKILDDQIEDCFCGDRGPMFHRLSWAQWSLAEIESGEAMARLIDV